MQHENSFRVFKRKQQRKGDSGAKQDVCYGNQVGRHYASDG